MTDHIHPANTLSSAIERIQVLLSGLARFYEQPREIYALEPYFIMQSLRVVEDCADQASDALASLLQHCDLTLLPDLVDREEDFVGQAAAAELVDDQSELIVGPNDDQIAELPEQQIAAAQPMADADYINDGDETIELHPVYKAVSSSSQFTKSGPSEQFAQTYLELLQKLTAAEIFATEQQALSPNQSQQQPLLPLLRSLRQDIQKLHNVA